MRERRTKFNLRRDGARIVANHILTAIQRVGGWHSVYVDWRWDVRVIQDRCVKQEHRPDSERLGRYKAGVKESFLIEDLNELLTQ